VPRRYGFTDKNGRTIKKEGLIEFGSTKGIRDFCAETLIAEHKVPIFPEYGKP
jgi:hypothetical protein